MEIQTQKRATETQPRLLVLYAHFSFDRSGTDHSPSFSEGMAEIYEAPSERATLELLTFEPCSAEPRFDPVLSCYGEGLEDWQSASACIDCWSRWSDVPPLEKLLASWLLSCTAGTAGTYVLLARVCCEADLRYWGEPVLWSAPEPGGPYKRTAYPVLYSQIQSLKHQKSLSNHNAS